MVSQLEVQDLLEEYLELYLASLVCHRCVGVTSTMRCLFFLLFSEERFKAAQNLISVKFVVEIPDEILTLFNCDLPMHPFIDSVVDLKGVFVGHLCLDMHLEKV